MVPFVTSLEAADYLSGALLLVDKPQGWTSFDVVNKVRGILRQKYGVKKIKVGHSGTLDPMATGLLVICTGHWTKELHQLTGLDKKYDACITLGIETDSYDADGKIIQTKNVPALTETEIKALLLSFIGDIEQYPPAFSAIKKEGTPLYALARAGKEVKTEARKVKVFSIEMKKYNPPVIDLTVHCGSGFYVRSLAHDLGEKIGCGAHLSGLVRTSVGHYELNDAFTVDQIRNAFSEKG